jgi:hypothetical protein
MLAWILAGVAFLIAFVLILKIVEIAVDLRRRIPRGSRARQLRLGFVETFDLDGERQLLLVRRDNVEHLLLIGGPNDVLVESGIVRVEPREGREPRNARAAEAPAAVPPPPPSSIPAPAAVEPPHAIPAPPPFTIPAPAPETTFQSFPAAPPEKPAPEPAPTPTFTPPAIERAAPRFPLPPRVGAPRPVGPLPPPRFPAPSTAPGDAPPRTRFVMPPIARRATPVAPPPAPQPSPAPESIPPESIHTTESKSAPEPAPVEHPVSVAESSTPPSFVEPKLPVFEPPEASEPPAPEPAPSAPSQPAKPDLSFDGEFEPLESLEEEMAKLLGRPLKK